MPDGSFPDHITNFENMFDFRHSKTCSLTPWNNGVSTTLCRRKLRLHNYQPCRKLSTMMLTIEDGLGDNFESLRSSSP